jgi:two-component system chemotaxis response regulator CheB
VNRDVIVIGASAGGVELLLELMPELPASLPASLFVVVHTSPGHATALAEVLSSHGHLPAAVPLHGDPIATGRVYVAPPDSHLLVRPGFVEVVRGPRENGHRPAVDPLFRTASWAYGPRVVGVILTGYQDCGTAGMMSVKARGGVVVVQDPATAAAPEMPQSVLRRVEVDHVVHPLQLPGLLVRLASERAPIVEPPPSKALEQLEGKRNGTPAPLVCPTCQGVLTEAHGGDFEQYRCHLGHAFTLDALAHEQSERVERVLWAAVRSLEESATLSRRLAVRTVDDSLRRRFVETGGTQFRQADTIRRVLLEGGAKMQEPEPETAEHGAPPAGTPGGGIGSGA